MFVTLELLAAVVNKEGSEFAKKKIMAKRNEISQGPIYVEWRQQFQLNLIFLHVPTLQQTSFHEFYFALYSYSKKPVLKASAFRIAGRMQQKKIHFREEKSHFEGGKKEEGRNANSADDRKNEWR